MADDESREPFGRDGSGEGGRVASGGSSGLESQGMSRILVINDNRAVGHRIVELLNASVDWDAEYSAHVEDAVARLEVEDYGLVVLDLLLADAEDRGPLRRVMASDPLRPVLLTGSDGRVDQLVGALQSGAAGFVHNAKLDLDLLDNIDRVMGAAHRNQIHARLLDCMTQSTTTFCIDNDPLLLPTLLTRFQASVTLFGVCEATDRTRIGIALEEALSNALYHGNLEVSSKLRERSLEDYYELAGQRRFSEPYASRRITVIETLTHELARFTIRDDGPGFDTQLLNREPDPEDLEAVSGRGLLMMRSFMDEVRFNTKGNEVTLTKYRADAGGNQGEAIAAGAG